MLRPILFLIFVAFLAACSKQKEESTQFRIIKGTSAGIDFQNTIQISDTFNAMSFEYIYNGSGVGIGDFNNDGLEDVFFGGNEVSSELYLNTGGLQFKKTTSESGTHTNSWVTGVSVTDINQDGLLDIYLCVGGLDDQKRANLLFVNQGIKNGIPVFEEKALSYGLSDSSYSTMAAFLDYDKDGDPDMYLVNNWLEQFNRNNLRAKRINGEAESTDRLYRNNGDNTFTDVSREAGILVEGYGLGVSVCDINNDSWPDIYVANDFMSNDLFWINQGDGTFRNRIGEFLKHQTHNGMGVDINDFNNDQNPDIVVVDMLPPGHYRQKIMTPGQNYDHFHMSMNLGYEPQYMRNTLQMNRGVKPDGTPLFSEIAFMAGVASTDWSWAPLFTDLDNDGWKDLFIANGYRKDVTNLDFVFFGNNVSNPFGTAEARKKISSDEFRGLEEVKLSNYIFRNNGSLRFEDKSKAWGIDYPTFSNGTAYADFDNDGDQDLITNNIDQEVILYENKLNSRPNAHYLRLTSLDTGEYNQKIRLYSGGNEQFQEFTPYRGFQSSVSQYIHFGTGKTSLIDSLIIEWMDGKRLTLLNVRADTTIAFHRSMANGNVRKAKVRKPELFSAYSVPGLGHQENSPSDIKMTRTLLGEVSRTGPCVATGDVNNDGLDDLFVGGERGADSKVYIQNTDGTFSAVPLRGDLNREDGAAAFFDADNDADLDLYVGSTCPAIMEPSAPHRFYRNKGNGEFEAATIIPDITVPTSCVTAEDYDGDGDQDLFIGGRIKPGEYPFTPRSYVLRNDGGIFSDVTASLNEALPAPGMVTSAVWADINGDKRKDLAIAGEWMGIRVFINNGGKFTEETKNFGLENTSGWWRCLRAADLNGDGFPEIIAGNTGRNSFFQPSTGKEVMVTAKDFDKNGSVDPIITYFNPIEQDRYILHNRLVIIDQIPSIKRRFETFSSYAKTPFERAFTKEEVEGSFTGRAELLSSLVLENLGGKSFRIHELAEEAQLSTLNDILVIDVNKDGKQDLVGIGNSYDQETLFGRYDASIGLILLGDGKLGWRNLNPTEANFIADGNTRRLLQMSTTQGKALVVANNNEPFRFYRIR